MASGESKTFVAANERVLILLLCIAAALRVFIFSAAFPFFSNIDEDLHFDLITQYSHAQVPRGFDRLKEETLNWIVPYASPEFLFPPEQFPDGKFPAPLWKQPWSKVEPEIAATRAAWSSEINFESSQPPLYYAFAGAVVVDWEADWIGRHSIVVLDSVPECRAHGDVVWLAYIAARTIAPERIDVRIGVPLLAGFYSAECVLRNEQRCAVAAVFRRVVPLRFAMVANGPAELFARNVTGRRDCVHVSDQTVEFAADRQSRSQSSLPGLSQLFDEAPRAGLIALTALDLCAAVPICSWMVWLKLQFGDLTGSTAKIAFLGLDSETVRRVVAASDFQPSRALGFLVGFNRELFGAAKLSGTANGSIGKWRMGCTPFLRSCLLRQRSSD